MVLMSSFPYNGYRKKNLLGLCSFLSPDWFLCQFFNQKSNFFTLDFSDCCPMMFLRLAGLYLSTHMSVSPDFPLSS